MVAACGSGAMLYILPMLLGRTYDMKTDSVGIDIFDKEVIEQANKNPFQNPVVTSVYTTTEDLSEKRDFMGISGEMTLKMASGVLDASGSGKLIQNTAEEEKSVGILIKVSFITQIEEINPDAKPIAIGELRDQDSVGTHVCTDMFYGGELIASVKFVARNKSYVQEIRAEVEATISKEGTFNLEAQGKLDLLARNLSRYAKMEMDYVANVPLEGVSTTMEGLQGLVQTFKDQVEKVNNGAGVPICCKMAPLSNYDDKFTYAKNAETVDAMNDFNYLFSDIQTAESIMRSFVRNLGDEVPDDYLKKIMEFSERLTKTLSEFQKVIANLNMEEGTQQLSPAEKAFDENSQLSGVNRYTKEINKIIAEYPGPGEHEIPPRALYTHWGKRSCDNQASDIVYIGYMAADFEAGIGAGSNYQCLPENPNLKMDFDTTGLNERTSKLAAVRFSDMSMFKNGKHLQDKVVPCVVCETPMRPTVIMLPGMSCPGDWVQEYSGYLASNAHGRMRSENVCINRDPDTYETIEKTGGDPILTPVKIGKSSGDGNLREDASISCSVCSK